MKHLLLLILLLMMYGVFTAIPESENMTDFTTELVTAFGLSVFGGGVVMFWWRQEEHGRS